MYLVEYGQDALVTLRRRPFFAHLNSDTLAAFYSGLSLNMLNMTSVYGYACVYTNVYKLRTTQRIVGLKLSWMSRPGSTVDFSVVQHHNACRRFSPYSPVYLYFLAVFCCLVLSVLSVCRLAVERHDIAHTICRWIRRMWKRYESRDEKN